MAKFSYKETMRCYVTFERIIEADSAEEALELARDGAGSPMPVEIGDLCDDDSEESLLPMAN